MDDIINQDGCIYMTDKLPGEPLDSDQDSQDSNREDHENVDYPEERSSFDEEEYHQEIDEEEAAKRYNKKSTKKIGNKVLDNLMKKREEEDAPYVPKNVPTRFEEDDDVVDGDTRMY
jgi:hypothetical protein